jgi:hypothetical protein
MAGTIIGALRVTLGLDSTQFSRGVQKAETASQRLSRSMQTAGYALSAIGVGVGLAMRGRVQEIDALANSATQIGVPVEALSQLAYAAEQADVTIEALEKALAQMSRRMIDNAGAFEKVGVAVTDASGQIRPVLDVFMDVADAIAAMPEGAERTAAAMDLMGRSGGDMVPLINDGAQAIRDLMQEADDLGLTISEETAAAIQAFDDNMKKLKGSLSGLTNQIVGRLAPALEDISGYIAGLAEKFGQLTPEMQTFVSVLAGLLVVVGPILIGLGLLVTAIGAISAPVLAVIAGIGLLTAALWAFWPTLVSAKDAIVAFVTEGLDRAREAIHNMATAMRDGALQAVAWVKQGFEELMEFFRSLPEQFMEFGRNIITGLWDGLKEKWDAMSNWFSGKVDELLNILPWRAEIQSPSRVMHRQGAYLVEGLDNGIRSGMQAPIDSMRELAETLMSTMDEQDIHRGTMRLADLFEAIIDGSMDAREALGQLLQELAKVQLQKALLGLAGGGGVFGQLAGALGEALTAPSFAGGGYTGRAARVGGLDGQGGFLAIMHPRETVIDHADGLPAGGHVEVVVRVEGGNIVAEIERVSGGVTARAVAAYDRNLSQRVRQINGDRRAV